eukprot:CAMPEP_0197580142 /NCGR_PEP_ID=MMETSP1326-20131121/4001_1 /TAXON_ID=1155430 /ORGANISM="Genus nov. species nov., Strain RCC2288" /LENGTH=102 /DNA_ID=CAMNT_0043143807 /DNA_START=155 /DNA_END=459 /DNA_ORIENTATION=-
MKRAVGVALAEHGPLVERQDLVHLVHEHLAPASEHPYGAGDEEQRQREAQQAEHEHGGGCGGVVAAADHGHDGVEDQERAQHRHHHLHPEAHLRAAVHVVQV